MTNFEKRGPSGASSESRATGRRARRPFYMAAAALVSVCGALAACSGSIEGGADEPSDAVGGAAGRGGSAGGVVLGNGHATGGSSGYKNGGPEAGSGGAPACVQSTAAATLVKKPVDIIFIIDNSASMGQEIAQVQQNINQNLAQIIDGSGIDYRVIMLSGQTGTVDEGVCVSSPL